MCIHENAGCPKHRLLTWATSSIGYRRRNSGRLQCDERRWLIEWLDKAVVITCITSDLRARNHTRPALGTDWTMCRSVPLNHQPIARQFRRLEHLFPKPFERASATRTDGSKGTLTWAYAFASSRIVLHRFTPFLPACGPVRPKRSPAILQSAGGANPIRRIRSRSSITGLPST